MVVCKADLILFIPLFKVIIVPRTVRLLVACLPLAVCMCETEIDILVKVMMTGVRGPRMAMLTEVMVGVLVRTLLVTCRVRCLTRLIRGFLTIVATLPVIWLQLTALPRLLDRLVVVRLRRRAMLMMKARGCLRLKVSILRALPVRMLASATALTGKVPRLNVSSSCSWC